MPETTEAAAEITATAKPFNHARQLFTSELSHARPKRGKLLPAAALAQ
jgi:hypothetical protein